MDETLQENLRLFRISDNLLCTKSFYFLYRDYFTAIDHFFFIVGVVSRSDEGAKRAAKALAFASSSDEERIKYNQIIEGPDYGFEKLKKFSFHSSQTLVAATNQAFSCYISHILRSALQKNDNMLRSREQINLDEILDFKTKKELVSYLIDKKVNELSYGGMRQLEQYISDRLGLKLFHNDQERKLQTIFNELRNIMVHNRGYVNDTFLTRVKDHMGFEFNRNERFVAGLDEIAALSSNCMLVAQRFDQQVAAKFKIETRRYRTWLKRKPSYVD